MSNEKKGLDEKEQAFRAQELAQYGDPGKDVMHPMYHGLWVPESGNVYAVMGEGYPFVDRTTLANKDRHPVKYRKDDGGVNRLINGPVAGLMVRTDTGAQIFLLVARSRIKTVPR